MTNTQILIAAIGVVLLAVYFWMSRRSDDAAPGPAAADNDAKAKADALVDADVKAKADAKARADDAATKAKADEAAESAAAAKSKADEAKADAADAKAKADADAARAKAKADADADAAAAAKAKADAAAKAKADADAAAAKARADADAAAAAAKAKADADVARAKAAAAAQAEPIKTPVAESFGSVPTFTSAPTRPSTPAAKSAESGGLVDDSKTTTPYAKAEGAPMPAPLAPPAAAKKDEFDLRLDDLESKPKVPVAAPAPAAKPAVVSPTAELEKADPDHAKARRFARVAVSEIKLYHEQEVKDGRVAKDLWKRLNQDIMMSIQTYEKRVSQGVRDKFDYLYDELVRQLAEGKPELLGAEAPTATANAKPMKR